MPFPGSHPWLRRVALPLVVVAITLVPAGGPAVADADPPALLVSHYETDVPLHLIDRDAAYSVPIPGSGQDFWVFGDSFWTGGYLFGSTAAIGPYTPGQVPTELTELPTPPGEPTSPSARDPQRFLPVPTGLFRPDGADCVNSSDTAPATWPTGAALIPGSDDVLITTMDVCIMLPASITVERSGVVEYDPVHNQFLNQTSVFQSSTQLPFQLILGSPVFGADGYLHLFGSTCDDTGNSSGACLAGRVVTARVPADPTDWRNPFSYTFWTGTDWSPDASLAANVVPGARPAGLVHVADASALGQGLALIEQVDLSGGYRIWRSDAPNGDWTSDSAGTTPCGTSVIPYDVCRTYALHPEVSTADAVMLTYYNPGQYHTAMLAVPWYQSCGSSPSPARRVLPSASRWLRR